MKKFITIILTLMLALSLLPVAKAENSFMASDWAMEEVMAAYEENLIPENLAKEDLTQNVTRAEFAAIAVTLYENLIGEEVYVDTDSMPFDDIDKSLYIDEIITAYGLKITNGTSENTFSPDALITREQMATMILRALRVAEIDTTAANEPNFADNDEISEYAKDAVSFMSENGIINGVGDNKFAPESTATCEQAILISYRCVNVFKESALEITLGNTLLNEFKSIAPYGDAFYVAEELCKSEMLHAISLVSMPIEPGYLAGFDDVEIEGFIEGATFAPMIGSIPFVGYVFTLDNEEYAKTFAEMLETAANPRWNICVRAEETVVGSYGNKVFFVMCPVSLEK